MFRMLYAGSSGSKVNVSWVNGPHIRASRCSTSSTANRDSRHARSRENGVGHPRQELPPQIVDLVGRRRVSALPASNRGYPPSGRIAVREAQLVPRVVATKLRHGEAPLLEARPDHARQHAPLGSWTRDPHAVDVRAAPAPQFFPGERAARHDQGVDFALQPARWQISTRSRAARAAIAPAFIEGSGAILLSSFMIVIEPWPGCAPPPTDPRWQP